MIAIPSSSSSSPQQQAVQHPLLHVFHADPVQVIRAFDEQYRHIDHSTALRSQFQPLFSRLVTTTGDDDCDQTIPAKLLIGTLRAANVLPDVLPVQFAAVLARFLSLPTDNASAATAAAAETSTELTTTETPKKQSHLLEDLEEQVLLNIDSCLSVLTFVAFCMSHCDGLDKDTDTDKDNNNDVNIASLSDTVCHIIDCLQHTALQLLHSNNINTDNDDEDDEDNSISRTATPSSDDTSSTHKYFTPMSRIRPTKAQKDVEDTIDNHSVKWYTPFERLSPIHYDDDDTDDDHTTPSPTASNANTLSSIDVNTLQRNSAVPTPHSTANDASNGNTPCVNLSLSMNPASECSSAARSPNEEDGRSNCDKDGTAAPLQTLSFDLTPSPPSRALAADDDEYERAEGDMDVVDVPKKVDETVAVADNNDDDTQGFVALSPVLDYHATEKNNDTEEINSDVSGLKLNQVDDLQNSPASEHSGETTETVYNTDNNYDAPSTDVMPPTPTCVAFADNNSSSGHQQYYHDEAIDPSTTNVTASAADTAEQLTNATGENFDVALATDAEDMIADTKETPSIVPSVPDAVDEKDGGDALLQYKGSATPEVNVEAILTPEIHIVDDTPTCDSSLQYNASVTPDPNIESISAPKLCITNDDTTPDWKVEGVSIQNGGDDNIDAKSATGADCQVADVSIQVSCVDEGGVNIDTDYDEPALEDESVVVLDALEHADGSIEDGAMISTVGMVERFSDRRVSVTMQLSGESEVTLNVESGIWAEPCDAEALISAQAEEETPTPSKESEDVANEADVVETCASNSPEDLDGKSRDEHNPANDREDVIAASPEEACDKSVCPTTPYLDDDADQPLDEDETHSSMPLSQPRSPEISRETIEPKQQYHGAAASCLATPSRERRGSTSLPNTPLSCSEHYATVCEANVSREESSTHVDESPASATEVPHTPLRDCETVSSNDDDGSGLATNADSTPAVLNSPPEDFQSPEISEPSVAVSDSWTIRERRILNFCSSTNDDHTHTQSSRALPSDDDSDCSSDSNYSEEEDSCTLRGTAVAVQNQSFEELGREVNDDGLSEIEAAEEAQLEEEEYLTTDSSADDDADDADDDDDDDDDAPLHELRNAITMLEGTAHSDDKEFNTTFLDREEDIVDAALTDETRRDFMDIACARAAMGSKFADYPSVDEATLNNLPSFDLERLSTALMARYVESMSTQRQQLSNSEAASSISHHHKRDRLALDEDDEDDTTLGDKCVVVSDLVSGKDRINGSGRHHYHRSHNRHSLHTYPRAKKSATYDHHRRGGGAWSLVSTPKQQQHRRYQRLMGSGHETSDSDDPRLEDEPMPMRNAEPSLNRMDDITRVSTTAVNKRNIADGSSSGGATMTNVSDWPVAKTSPGGSSPSPYFSPESSPHGDDTMLFSDALDEGDVTAEMQKHIAAEQVRATDLTPAGLALIRKDVWVEAVNSKDRRDASLLLRAHRKKQAAATTSSSSDSSSGSSSGGIEQTAAEVTHETDGDVVMSLGCDRVASGDDMRSTFEADGDAFKSKSHTTSADGSLALTAAAGDETAARAPIVQQVDVGEGEDEGVEEEEEREVRKMMDALRVMVRRNVEVYQDLHNEMASLQQSRRKNRFWRPWMQITLASGAIIVLSVSVVVGLSILLMNGDLFTVDGSSFPDVWV